jgi:hemerythrin-like domain-containing protein
MTTPTDVLRDEHRVILRALELVERAIAPADGPVADLWWTDLVAWLRAFADENHHAKEEQALFPALVKAGVPVEGGPVGVMLDEHAQGRALVAAMAGARGAARVAAARQYIALLRAHIDKENDVLFPLADAVVDERLMATVRREFETVRLELGASVSIESAEAAVARLRSDLGRR